MAFLRFLQAMHWISTHQGSVHVLPINAPGYSRAFYLTAVTAWTAAVAIMFITAVWGGFQGLMNRVARIEESRQSSMPPPGTVVQGGEAVGRIAPDPFASQHPAAPSGWTVRETIKGPEALEIRAGKLFSPKEPHQGREHATNHKAQPAHQAPKPVPQTQPAPQTQPPLTAGETGVVKSVKFEPSQDTFLFSVTTSATPEKTGFFYLDNPRRLAVNIQGTWRNAAPRVTEFPTGPIARVNIGEHPDYVRITLTFRNPSAPRPKDPTLTKVKDGLQVSLSVQ